MQVEDLTLWLSFQKVAAYSSFSQAAKEMKVTNSQLSKRIAKLEDLLEARLFQRSTRSVSLTAEGAALLPKIQSILSDLTEVESRFSGGQELSGKVRLTCVPFIAKYLVQPTLKEFQKDFPGIDVEIELSKNFLNLIETGIDLAIRIETPQDSELIYKKLAPNTLIFCASPDYLANSPGLSTPSELKNHKLLTMTIHDRCKIKNSHLEIGSFAAARKTQCDDGVFLTDLACDGQGVLVRSIWAVREKLQSGELKQVLVDYPIETFGHIYAVIPSKRYLAPRVRTFMDYLIRKSESLFA